MGRWVGHRGTVHAGSVFDFVLTRWPYGTSYQGDIVSWLKRKADMSPNERGSWLTWTDDGRLSVASGSDLGRKASGKDRFAHVASWIGRVLSSESKGQSVQTLRVKSVGFPEMEKGHSCTPGDVVELTYPTLKTSTCKGSSSMTLQPCFDHMAPVLDVGALSHSHFFLTWHWESQSVSYCVRVKWAWLCADGGWPALPLYCQGLCSLRYVTSTESLRGAKQKTVTFVRQATYYSPRVCIDEYVQVR